MSAEVNDRGDNVHLSRRMSPTAGRESPSGSTSRTSKLNQLVQVSNADYTGLGVCSSTIEFLHEGSSTCDTIEAVHDTRLQPKLQHSNESMGKKS